MKLPRRLLFPASILVVAAGWVGVSVWAEPRAAKPEAITAESLNERPVIGALGIPLGQSAEVRATVVDGDSLRKKAYAGTYLLRIDAVDGKSLDKPPTVRFDLGFSDARLANDSSGFEKLKEDLKNRGLSSKQISEFEKSYVGSTVNLAVYELGDFSGIPTILPKDFEMSWSDSGFHFRTYLVVLKQRG